MCLVDSNDFKGTLKLRIEEEKHTFNNREFIVYNGGRTCKMLIT
jgi:hypothetical protein